ncbi:GDSL-type esterase/lipase family protein [Croceicoccus sp. Ery5]|uniref:GDSL-type esterase/lipase family protein n=1 Tax=Croceicoccus sp. Ery5 TaxID=1703340 RepID=UPI001E5E17D7|nr:GDSL-type esterase/lipase family protein [Croceicoccus sp. Ery5]
MDGARCSARITPRTPRPAFNLARNGRSSGSYRAEGLWDIALREMKVGGYGTVFALIGFGHNDQPGKPGRSTDLESEFPANMKRYVQEARAAGAVPVLFTPLTRRLFNDGKVERDLDPWAEAIRKVAAETDTPLIDLNARSTEIVQALGPSVQNLTAEIPAPAEVAAAAAIDGETLPSATGRPTPAPVPDDLRVARMTWVYDYTHLGEFGGKLFAAVLADELASEVPEMRKLLRP